MQLLLPPDIIERLIAALAQAGRREIGGILMGEHVSENVFRVKEITIQQYGGRTAAFSRSVVSILRPLHSFFKKNNQDYRRFNYLGEWHSHPSFVPEPSVTDCRTMRDIIEDPQVGAHFVVLLIVRLDLGNQLVGSVTIFQQGVPQFKGELMQECECAS
jgi:integrative and conjugative element protein (TIGR02256 family)